ncbi:MAG: hypothetical protein GYB68_17660, partial [Chloroflexi bacterium]|nr:hypothetical protein [Chloroflexota bacterium]
QEDPLKRFLGPLYTLFENKYYLDEVYWVLFVKPAQAIANWIYVAIDQAIINGVIHTVGRFAEWLGFRFKDADTELINRAGDEMAGGVGQAGASFRYVQSGSVQQYLAVGLAGTLMLVAVFVWAIFLR